MNIAQRRLECTGCGCCAAACPSSCISMEADSEGFFYPKINGDACIDCGKCRKICPVNSLLHDRGATAYFMAQHKDKDVLSLCSSGGVFDALAEAVISQDGVVFGVVWDQDARMSRHVAATSLEEIAPMRLSKYSQSVAWGAYPEVRRHLARGRRVLFTGTPCQIAGLYAYLGERHSNDSNLLTMEVLCHGVTSNYVVQRYLKSKERSFGTDVVGVRFRTKDRRRGWEDSSHVVLELSDNDGLKTVRDRMDTFMFGYVRSLYLRESCYRCRYCSTNRVADFMAADFWGVGDSRIGKDQRRLGVSLLAVTGERAAKMLPNLALTLDADPIDADEATPRNGALVEPTYRPKARDTLIGELADKDFDKVILGHYKSDILKTKIKTLVGPRMTLVLRTAKRRMFRR